MTMSEMFDTYSLPVSPSTVEKPMEARIVKVLSNNEVITFEMLHNLRIAQQ